MLSHRRHVHKLCFGRPGFQGSRQSSTLCWWSDRSAIEASTPAMEDPSRTPSDDRVVDALLGELEARIMRVMWPIGVATVREVLDALSASGRPLAYTTVMTVMCRLARKGILSRERRGKMHVYKPAVTRDEFIRLSAARRMQDLIEDFGDVVIVQFLSEVTALSPERRAQLERLLSNEGP
jgi:predicted transcriptional regulator